MIAAATLAARLREAGVSISPQVALGDRAARQHRAGAGSNRRR